MELQLYLSRLKSDFYAVKIKVFVPFSEIWISYMILVQVVPLVANNYITAISHPFSIGFLCCKKKVGLPIDKEWISYKLILQAVPLEAHYGILVISDP